METKFRNILADEGFKNIYIWEDKPEKECIPHEHSGKVTTKELC